jgi:hypothetical protein
LLLVCGCRGAGLSARRRRSLHDPGPRRLLVAYLSLVGVGQEFLSFQWDSLLLEAGALAILTSAWPTALAWLYRWLLFRLMFMSGIVKLMSGDVAWRNLTALTYHFETQPLPNPLSWYVHQLPPAVLHGMTAGTLVIEDAGPVHVLSARDACRRSGPASRSPSSALIFVTGNYTFFNVLTMALALWLLDDETVLAGLPRALSDAHGGCLPGPPSGWRRWPVQVAVRDRRVRERRHVLGGARRLACRRASPLWKRVSSRAALERLLACSRS